MPPAELSLFALRRRQCCKQTHTDTHMWSPTRTGTLTARIVHTAHSSWPRTTNALATPPRTVPLSFCTTRPVMLWLRAIAFVFRSCDKRRQFSHAFYCHCCCCCCFVISLIWLQQQRWGGGGWGEESNSEAGLAQFAFTWPRVSLLLSSRMPPCVRACVLCGGRERERALSAKLTTDYPVAAYGSPLCCCLSADTCSACWRKLFAIHPQSVLPDCCNCTNIYRMPL